MSTSASVIEARAATLSGPPPPRRCGRCRNFFPGDATLDPSAAAKWWACTSCHRALFGDTPSRHVLARR